MATAQTIIHSALMRLGVVASGENATTTELEDALAILNNLLDEWKTYQLYLYGSSRTTYTLTANTGAYTLGTGQTLNQVKPLWVDAVSVLPVTTGTAYELPLHLYDPGEYDRISMKTLTNTYPEAVDIAVNAETLTLTFYPVPTTACQIAVYVPTDPLDQITALSTDVVVPAGYRNALIFNLAQDLAEPFGRPVTPFLAKRATETFAGIRRVNSGRKGVMSVDAALIGAGGAYDIRSDSGA